MICYENTATSTVVWGRFRGLSDENYTSGTVKVGRYGWMVLVANNTIGRVV